jgi:hypothetical protein
MKWTSVRRSKLILVVAAVVTTNACGHRNVIPAPAASLLERADRFELLSLDPNIQLRVAEEDFHGYRVLETVVIADPEIREKLVSDFRKAVAENQGVAAACFNPRHGIRVTRNEKRADFVICFQCDQVQVYGEVRAEFLITNSAEKLFDSVLRSKGVRGADM